MNFDQRPIVGICLKRCAMTESGQPRRLNTFIDIPDSLRLPHFMLVGAPDLEENGLRTEYKLVLQSVVCHRGGSLQSGHYIAFARAAPKLLTDSRRHDLDPPPDYEEAQWVLFDDLETENWVAFVDNIKRSLRRGDALPVVLSGCAHGRHELPIDRGDRDGAAVLRQVESELRDGVVGITVR